MTVSELQRIRQQRIGQDDGQRLPVPREGGGASGPSFGDTLAEAIDSVDESQKVANAEMEAFVSGEKDDVHDVVIAMNQAKMQFQLMTEVRSKTIQAYQELMRMQV